MGHWYLQAFTFSTYNHKVAFNSMNYRLLPYTRASQADDKQISM